MAIIVAIDAIDGDVCDEKDAYLGTVAERSSQYRCLGSPSEMGEYRWRAFPQDIRAGPAGYAKLRGCVHPLMVNR